MDKQKMPKQPNHSIKNNSHPNDSRMIKKTSDDKHFSWQQYLMFFIPSALGIFLFVIPIEYHNQYSIPLALCSKWFLSLFTDHGNLFIVSLIMFTTIMSVFYRIYQPYMLIQNEFIHRLLYPSWTIFILRLIGGVLLFLSFLQIGPEFIWGSKTGTIMREIVLPGLVGIFIFAGLFLPLLLNFGLLEFISTIATNLMRRIFNLPGSSAVDCLVSWFGDSAVGIVLTNKQYENKTYTQREAAIITTMFSSVSLSFSLFVVTYVGLSHLFLAFYITICFASIVSALILPRLPPLCYKKDRYIDGSYPNRQHDSIPKTYNTLSWAFTRGIEKAKQITSYTSVIKDSCKNIIELLLGILPVIMALGTISLILAEYTPILRLISKPIMFYLDILGVPQAELAATAISSGFTNMIQPAFSAISIENEMTRFIIASVSVTQLIYMIEVGAILIGSRIPLNIFEIFLIFILRTILTLPIIVGITYLLF